LVRKLMATGIHTHGGGVQVLVSQRDGDAAAGELLEVLGFEHVDEVSRIVAVRPVRTHSSDFDHETVASLVCCAHERSCAVCNK
jgi:hypothetical protein